MAHSRPIETYYSRHATRKACVLLVYDARGRAVTERGAVLAATRHIFNGDWNRCDVYLPDGRHAYTVRRAGRSIDIQRHIRRRA